MSDASSGILSAEDVLHQLELQEGFQDQYFDNLDNESSDEDAPEGDFSTSDGDQMLIDCDMLTGKGFKMLFQFSTPAERDSLLLLDEQLGEELARELDISSDNSNMLYNGISLYK